jgi:RNA polymerase sigma factor (sigma-70 family)
MENRQAAPARNVSRLCEVRRTAGITDEELLRAFVNDREEAAFETLVHRHASRVLSVCRRVLGRGAEVEDAFQATFLVLARKAGTIRNHASLPHWLHGVAHRIAVRERVGTLRRQRQEYKAAEASARPREGDMDHRDLCHSVHQEIDHLPERYRQAVLLCYMQGFSTEEAARIVDCPHSTLKGRLVRAREILHDRFSRRGVTLGALLLFMIVPNRSPAEEAEPALIESTVKAGVNAATRRARLSGVSPRAVAMANRFLRVKGAERFGFYLLILGAIGVSSFSLSQSLADPRKGGLMAMVFDAARQYCH